MKELVKNPFGSVLETDNGDQIAPFIYDFTLEGKALDTEVVDETADGDLIIEGWAANFDVDRENEAFTEGAFERGLKAYLDNNPVICYHHDRKFALGQVLDAEVVEGKGLRIKGRIDSPEPNTPAADVWRKIKRGTIRCLSVGGFFKRKLTEGGWRINDVDFTEISVTPVPVARNAGTTFSVIAGKAFDGIVLDPIEEEIREEDEEQLRFAVETLERIYEKLSKRNSL